MNPIHFQLGLDLDSRAPPVDATILKVLSCVIAHMLWVIVLHCQGTISQGMALMQHQELQYI